MTVIKDNLIFIILCGIPCSGKSTWVKKNIDAIQDKYGKPVVVISRDTIRESTFDMKKYRYDDKGEKLVTEKFYKQLSHAINLKDAVVIIDNTHVKPARIDIYFKMFKAMIDNGAIKMYVKFFDIPLWKAKLRNFIRDWKTGKHIPAPVMEGMYANYKRLDKAKYLKHDYDSMA